jgi:hypothetical protein
LASPAHQLFNGAAAIKICLPCGVQQRPPNAPGHDLANIERWKVLLAEAFLGE